MANIIGLDLAASALVLVATATVGSLYVARRRRRSGYSPRIEREGSSVFLGRDAMQAAYDAFEAIGAALVRAGVSANTVTACGVVLAFVAGVCAAFGALGLAAVIGAIAAAIDGLDGIVARSTTGPTADGALYDAAADRYMEFFLLGGLLIHVRQSVLALSIVLGALLGAFMVSYVSAKGEAAPIKPPRGAMRRAERAVYLLGGCALAPIAALIFPTLGFAYDVPVLLACALVGLVANVSALLRLLALARAVAKPTSKPRTNTHRGSPPGVPPTNPPLTVAKTIR